MSRNASRQFLNVFVTNYWPSDSAVSFSVLLTVQPIVRAPDTAVRRINASITAYSTAVGPSALPKNRRIRCTYRCTSISLAQGGWRAIRPANANIGRKGIARPQEAKFHDRAEPAQSVQAELGAAVKGT